MIFHFLIYTLMLMHLAGDALSATLNPVFKNATGNGKPPAPKEFRLWVGNSSVTGIDDVFEEKRTDPSFIGKRLVAAPATNANGSIYTIAEVDVYFLWIYIKLVSTEPLNGRTPQSYPHELDQPFTISDGKLVYDHAWNMSFDEAMDDLGPYPDSSNRRNFFAEATSSSPEFYSVAPGEGPFSQREVNDVELSESYNAAYWLDISAPSVPTHSWYSCMPWGDNFNFTTSTAFETWELRSVQWVNFPKGAADLSNCTSLEVFALDYKHCPTWDPECVAP